jgi:hypothetical protein
MPEYFVITECRCSLKFQNGRFTWVAYHATPYPSWKMFRLVMWWKAQFTAGNKTATVKEEEGGSKWGSKAYILMLLSPEL